MIISKNRCHRTFIICPVIVPIETLQKVVKAVESTGSQAFYWDRHTKYDPLLLYHADAVVIVPPRNEFNFNRIALPNGASREFNDALEDNTPIYLAHCNLNGSYFIYRAHINNASILGVSMTFDDLTRVASKFVRYKPLESVVPAIGIRLLDRRLLLFLK